MGTLSDMMELDHVVTVHDDGTVTDGPAGIYAPDVFEGGLSSPDWELLNGYSGQHGYSGPWMHASEFIGGGLAADILSTPGVYVAVADLDGDAWGVARYVGHGKG